MTFAYLAEFMAQHPSLKLIMSFQGGTWNIHLHDHNDECLMHVEGSHVESTLGLVIGAMRELN